MKNFVGKPLTDDTVVTAYLTDQTRGPIFDTRAMTLGEMQGRNENLGITHDGYYLWTHHDPITGLIHRH